VGLFSRLRQMFGGAKAKKTAVKKAAPVKPAKIKPAKLQKIDVKKRFDLVNRLGQGSMSKVWRARDKSMGRTVCLKLLDKEKTAKFENRFQGLNKPREGAIGYELKHANIVQTYEHGITTDGEPYLIMELIEGMGLNYLIETKSAQLNGKRAEVVAQIADAVEFLHKRGFMHRDICPRNVMVTREGQVKLIDFGLSIPNSAPFCRPGNRTGTPNYLAPELIRRTTTDQRVDLFALGVTAYEVYTGTLPWEKAQSLQTLLSHMNSTGKDPQEANPELDEETANVLRKAVARDPNERYQTAADLAGAFRTLKSTF
jgi:eukaryotic-like serine/threonine-protein kinase